MSLFLDNTPNYRHCVYVVDRIIMLMNLTCPDGFNSTSMALDIDNDTLIFMIFSCFIYNVRPKFRFPWYLLSFCISYFLLRFGFNKSIQFMNFKLLISIESLLIVLFEPKRDYKHIMQTIVVYIKVINVSQLWCQMFNECYSSWQF